MDSQPPRSPLPSQVPISSRAAARAHVRFPWQWGIPLLLFVLVAVWWHHRHANSAAIVAAEKELDAVLDGQLASLAKWRRERMDDAVFLSQAPFVRHDVAEFLAHPGDDAARTAVNRWLELIRTVYHYEHVTLFSSEGTPLLMAPAGASDLDSALASQIATACDTQQPSISDLHDGGVPAGPHFDLVVPVLPEGTMAGIRPRAVLLLRINARATLFPGLQRWPTSGPVGEILLLRREGDSFLVLNDVAREAVTALSLRIPVATAGPGVDDLAMTANAFVTAPDYRGIPVVAGYRAVPTTGWILGAKLAYADAIDTWGEPVGTAMLLGGIAVVIALGGLKLLWRNRETELLRYELASARALRASEERFELVATMIEEVFWMRDAALTQIGYVSPSYERVWGQSIASLQARPRSFLDPVHPDDRARILRVFDGPGHSQPFELEYRIVRADGTVRWISDRGYPIAGGDGRVTHFVGIAQDVTERKVAAERTAEALAYRRTILADAPIGIITYTAAGDAVTANAAAVRLIGGSQSELEQQNFHRLPSWRSSGLLAAALKALETGTEVELEAHFVSTFGQETWILCRFAPFQHEGQRQLVLLMLDVGARKQAEAALIEAERKYRAIFEQASEGIFQTTPAGRFLAANPSMARILGYESPEQLVAERTDIGRQGYADPARREEFQRLIAEHGSVTGFEYELVRRNGERIWISENARVVRSADGRVSYYEGTLQDITQRKVADQARLESERRFRDMLGNVELIAMTLDRDGVVTFCNDYLVRLTGWPAEELVGSNWFEKALPESAVGVREIFFACMASGTIPPHFENSIRLRDGEIRDIRWNNTVLRSHDGAVIGTASIGEDITDRKRAEEALRESEQRFRDLAENIPEVFWVKNATQTELIYVSPAYEKIWGRSLRSLYERPRSWIEAVHPHDQATVRATFADSARPEYRDTYRIMRPDGQVRWIRDQAFPLRDAAGTVYRVVGLAEDITERHELEEQLRQAQKMEAIGTLAGGIAHDFNNILATISGFAALAQMQAGDRSVVHDHLREVMRASDRAASLVRQILAFSRREEQQRIPLSLADPVGESVRLLRATLPATIEIVAYQPPRLPKVLADPTQVHQVVMNLATNAAHAMRGRAGKLYIGMTLEQLEDKLVTLDRDLRPGRYVQLTVRDNGCGMEPTVLRRVFEPFFTTKPPGEGTGLGLSVVHGIVAAHGGAITVTSEPGMGTAFNLFFPALDDDTAPAETSANALELGTGERVLVVDDEEPIARVVALTLGKLGYRPESFCSPLEAMTRFRSDPTAFDLVITDQTMPGLTGMALVAEVSRLRPDLPIILTTGYDPNLTPESVRSAGATELLPKPITVETLAAAVHRCLGPNSRPPCRESS